MVDILDYEAESDASKRKKAKDINLKMLESHIANQKGLKVYASRLLERQNEGKYPCGVPYVWYDVSEDPAQVMGIWQNNAINWTSWLEAVQLTPSGRITHIVRWSGRKDSQDNGG